MKNTLAFAALMAAVTFGANAQAAVGLESQQNLIRFAPMAGVASTGCNSCACPMECPCMPTCCPANRGIFDGGLNKCCVEQVVCPTPCGM